MAASYGHLWSVRELSEEKDGPIVEVTGSFREMQHFYNRLGDGRSCPAPAGACSELNGEERVQLRWCHEFFNASEFVRAKALNYVGPREATDVSSSRLAALAFGRRLQGVFRRQKAKLASKSSHQAASSATFSITLSESELLRRDTACLGTMRQTVQALQAKTDSLTEELNRAKAPLTPYADCKKRTQFAVREGVGRQVQGILAKRGMVPLDGVVTFIAARPGQPNLQPGRIEVKEVLPIVPGAVVVSGVAPIAAAAVPAGVVPAVPTVGAAPSVATVVPVAPVAPVVPAPAMGAPLPTMPVAPAGTAPRAAATPPDSAPLLSVGASGISLEPSEVEPADKVNLLLLETARIMIAPDSPVDKATQARVRAWLQLAPTKRLQSIQQLNTNLIGYISRQAYIDTTVTWEHLLKHHHIQAVNNILRWHIEQQLRTTPSGQGYQRSFTAALSELCNRLNRLLINAGLPPLQDNELIKLLLQGDGAPMVSTLAFLTLRLGIVLAKKHRRLLKRKYCKGNKTSLAVLEAKEDYDNMSTELAELFAEVNKFLHASRKPTEVLDIKLEACGKHPARTIRLRFQLRLGGDQAFVHRVLGLSSCGGDHACALCFAHRHHRGTYFANKEEFEAFVALVNGPLLREFFSPDDAGPRLDPKASYYKYVRSAEGKLAKGSNLGQDRVPLLDFTVHEVVFDELHAMMRVITKLFDACLRQFRPDDERLPRFTRLVCSITKHKSFNIVAGSGKKGSAPDPFGDDLTTKWEYPSLNGNKRFLLLQQLPSRLCEVFDGDVLTGLQRAWESFASLYTILSKNVVTAADVERYKSEAHLFLHYYLTVPNLSGRLEVTPYIHWVVHHASHYLVHHGALGQFSCEAMERHNSFERSYIRHHYNYHKPASLYVFVFDLLTDKTSHFERHIARRKRKHSDEDEAYDSDADYDGVATEMEHDAETPSAAAV
eukprot:m.149325 g.149325  ORF g.149325 m.149325 type:complete len:946 (+) comp9730_c0_seq3:164-3001(+)